MKKPFSFIFALLFIISLLFPLLKNVSQASEALDIYFFYSNSCAHCHAEQKFLDKLEDKYPEINVKRYLNTDQSAQSLLQNLAKKCGAERYLGLVPMTFIGEKFFLGFDNEQGIGAQIEQAIQQALGKNGQEKNHQCDQRFNVPFLGNIDTHDYSLPTLTVILGFLDGFNVCSLGALIFILGIVMALKSRKKTLLFGGIFILTTAVIYGLLMILWYQAFAIFGKYIDAMNFVIGGIALLGGLYFLRQFFRFKKYGASCDSQANKTVSKMTSRLSAVFQNSRNIFFLVGAVLVFAALIALIEFPCSAAVPVVYTGILAQAGLAGWQYFSYLAIFLLLYLMDEIIIFLIAFLTMRIWLSSQKFVTWITLVEGIVLVLLAFYYIFGWLL